MLARQAEASAALDSPAITPIPSSLQAHTIATEELRIQSRLGREMIEGEEAVEAAADAQLQLE